MAHRVKKDAEKRSHRGPTFVGLYPRVEDRISIKKRKMEKKHKNNFKEWY